MVLEQESEGQMAEVVEWIGVVVGLLEQAVW